MAPFLKVAHVGIVAAPLASNSVEEQTNLGVVICVCQNGRNVSWSITSGYILPVAAAAGSAVRLLAWTRKDSVQDSQAVSINASLSGFLCVFEQGVVEYQWR